MLTTPESGPCEGYDGIKHRRGNELQMAVDVSCHLLALHLTPARVDDRVAVARHAKSVKEGTDNSLTLVYANESYAGKKQLAHFMKIDRGCVPINSNKICRRAPCYRGENLTNGIFLHAFRETAFSALAQSSNQNSFSQLSRGCYVLLVGCCLIEVDD